MREPIASTLDPLTEAQVNAYRRLPGSFGEMLQAAYNDGWNGCHTRMAAALIESDFERDRLRDAIRETLLTNRHLADGDDCTLRALKLAVPDWE